MARLVLLALVFSAACDASQNRKTAEEQRLLFEQTQYAKRAAERLPDCSPYPYSVNADLPFEWDGNYIVAYGSLAAGYPQAGLHKAHDLLEDGLKYKAGAQNVTVFLVHGERREEIGKYETSQEIAYRESLEVCVVRFSDVNDRGTLVHVDRLVTFESPGAKQVGVPGEYPGYRAPEVVLAEWIRSLPSRS